MMDALSPSSSTTFDLREAGRLSLIGYRTPLLATGRFPPFVLAIILQIAHLRRPSGGNEGNIVL